MPSKAELRRKWDNAGENVVVLHQFARARSCPSPSPYPIKIETYLRMAGIKYENDFDQPMSSKNKSPWMTFNGYDMADSQLCMEHLAKTLKKDLSAHLTPEERAISRGMRAILEDNLYFCLVMERWVYGDLDYLLKKIFGPLPVPFPNFLAGLFMQRMRNVIKGQAEGQGIGRHTQEEVRDLGLKGLRALSDYLGDKPYMMGDTPTEIDCVLFGFTTMLICTTKEDNIYKKVLEKEMSNLKKHFELIKEKFWPDWEECKHKD